MGHKSCPEAGCFHVSVFSKSAILVVITVSNRNSETYYEYVRDHLLF